MVKKTAKEVAEDWASALKASTEKIRRGVERVEVNPFEEATKQEKKMLAKLVEAIESGRWRYELSKFTKDDYIKLMKELGIPRISKGVDMSLSEQEKFFTALLSHIEEGLREVEKIPKETLDDSIRRAEVMIRHMAKFKKHEKVK